LRPQERFFLGSHSPPPFPSLPHGTAPQGKNEQSVNTYEFIPPCDQRGGKGVLDRQTGHRLGWAVCFGPQWAIRSYNHPPPRSLGGFAARQASRGLVATRAKNLLEYRPKHRSSKSANRSAGSRKGQKNRGGNAVT